MNEFLFIAGVAGITFVCMAVWFGGKELLTRWFNNDWCHHDWGKWGDVEYEKRICQHRYCAKCNKMEKRAP